MLDMLGMSHQYGFIELEASISDYLKTTLNAQNVCLIFDVANMYNLQSLAQTCCEYMEQNADSIIEHESFLNLSAVSKF